MNKAILVIDMPEYCCNCPLNFWNSCGVLEAKEKLSGRIENPSTERLGNCPLKPAPEKIDVPVWDDSIKAKNANAEEVGVYMYDRGHYRGYNICIDKILGI